MENDKNYSRNHIGGFGGRTNSFWAGLNVWDILGKTKRDKVLTGIFLGPY